MVSTSGGVNEIIEDGLTGLLVPPNEPKALADAISRLLADKTFAAHVGAAGRASAASRFGIDQTCRDMAAVLREVA